MAEIGFFFGGLIGAPIIQDVYSYLTGIIRNAVGDVKKVLVELHNSLTFIRSLLERAEGELESRPEIRKAVRDLQLALYDAEDLLDQYGYGVQQIKVRNSISDGFKRFFVMRAKEVKEKLDRKREELEKQLVNQSRQPNFPAETQIAARKAIFEKSLADLRSQKLDILPSLADLRSRHRLSGICISGMPGIGKTAVAGSIYEDAQINYNEVFWVSLPDKFNRVVVLRDMLVQLVPGCACSSSEVAITKHLVNELRSKTFLLILDDVGVEHADECCCFILYLANILRGSGNSSIVLTTNNKEAASKMETIRTVPIHKHEMGKLSEEECWSIIEKNIHESSPLQVTSDLSAMGREIAKQCGGLPLVASVIGQKLGEHIEEDGYWEDVKNKRKLNSPHERKSILCELKRSSYDRLGSPLQKCFAYCSVFPKGYVFRSDELIQHWLAAGLLDDVGGSNYLDDLMSCYLLEVVEMDEFENIKSCKMHDEMHNLAFLLSDHETCLWPGSCPNEMSSIRRMRVVSRENFGNIPRKAFKRVRSLILEKDVSFTRAKKFSRRLRSLNVIAKSNEELQASIGKSKHVKYLDISGSGITEIPTSVTKLFYNLQTLRFEGCNSLTLLAGIIDGLDGLRYIYYDESHMPRSIGKLTSLCTLLFVVGTEEGRKIVELKCLNRLRELKICNLEEVPVSEATDAKLEDKEDLLALHCKWGTGVRASSDDEGVLSGLLPNSKLENLTIQNYKGSKFPPWMVMGDPSFRLQNLVHLVLINCTEYNDFASLGLLPELKVLIVKGVSGEKLTMTKSRSGKNRSSNIASSSQTGGQSVTVFRALIKLTLCDMMQLEKWTVEGAFVVPRLKKLHIVNCLSLQTLEINGSTTQEVSEVSLQSCQNLQAISNTRKINFLDIKDCPHLSVYDQNQMGRIKCNDRMVKPQL